MQKRSHEQKLTFKVNTNYVLEILKQYANQLKVSNHYDSFFVIISNCDRCLHSRHDDFHLDQFILFENSIRLLLFHTGFSEIFAVIHIVAAREELMYIIIILIKKLIKN